MAYTSGPLNASSSVSVGGGGDKNGSYTNGGTWTNPGNGAVIDGSSATAGMAASTVSTDTLKASGFGFNIPATAIIQGIKVEYLWTVSGGYFYSVGLNKGTNKTAGHTITGGVWAWGGPTDLWGSTWTAGDINSANLATFINATSSNGNGNSVSVDGARVTVYWDYPALPTGTIQKTHMYQVYRQGVYLGLLPEVTSEFVYSQDINTAGSQIMITCGISGDVSGLDAPTIDDEYGVPLQTEDGQTLQTEKYPDIIGNASSQGLFRNGNQIIVTEISDYSPNGKQVFSGQVERWNTVNGGVDGDVIILTVYSDGSELNNFIMTGGDALDQSVNISNRNADVPINKFSFGGYDRAGQTFIIGAGLTTLSAISVYPTSGSTADTLTLKVHSSVSAANAGSTPLATVTLNNNYVTGNTQELKFSLTPSLTVTPGQSLFFSVETSVNSSHYLAATTNNPYASGQLQTASYAGGSGGGTYGAATGDLVFNTYTGGSGTTVTYTNTDPTNMLIDAVARYNSKGGTIKTASGSTDLTARSLTYKFQVATLFEGIEKMLGLAPYNFYWYVDIGTNTLFFKQIAATPKYTFIKGRHYSSLNLGASTENVKNYLLFTGGIPSGQTQNLFTSYSDAASITSNKQKLERQTDNRVTITGTANALGTSFIDASKNETYETSVTVLDTTMDISLFRVGDTVGFAGNGNFIDGLILQITRVDYSPSQAILTLGQLPPRANQTMRDIEQALTDLETLANPPSPS